jgi:flagellar basal-body rod protein FlgF
MSNVIYAALSRQAGLEREFTSVANNVANASTAGFRGERHSFSEYVRAIPGEPSLSLTRVGARSIDLQQGELVATNGPLDVAIIGPGFFVVETPLGERLTRAGAFLRNAEGVLTTADGHYVHGEGGGAITIAAGAEQITISADGTISAGDAALGKLRIVDADVAGLQREGSSLFRSTAPVAERIATVRQGFIESSNVSPVIELSRMIEVQRAFEIGAQFLSEENDRIARAIEAIGGRR